MKTKIAIEGKIIFFIQILFYFYFVIQVLMVELSYTIGIYCLISAVICTVYTFGKRANATIQKYCIVLSLLVLATIYGISKGEIALIQGTLLAIVCLNSLHLDIKVNLFQGAYITLLYMVLLLFFPDVLFDSLAHKGDIIIKLVTCYIGQIMLIVLISLVYVQKKIIEIKNKNAKTMLKIVEEKRREATRANQSKSDFLANMSHEIRTPMNAIIGMSEIVLRSDIDNEVREQVLSIKIAGKSLLTIINDILDFSKMEAGKMEIIPVTYQMSSLLNDICNIAEVKIAEKPIEFISNVDKNLPFELYGDEIRIKQIVINLLNNATKFTSEGSITLTVTGTVQEDHIVLQISVRDTGIGIQKNNLNKLFSSFSQVDTKKNRAVEGTGLGLAICKNLTKMMGGYVTVESEYGKGSFFMITIPQMIVDHTPIGDFRKFKLNGRFEIFHNNFIAAKARVLIVDDNVVNLTVAIGLLRPYRMILTTASSAEECLDLLKTESFDIIFMDHMMPIMDGVEATEIIRKTDQETPIIALTANAISGVRDMYLQKGFNDYLAKPIEVEKMNFILKAYLPDQYMEELTASEAPLKEPAYSQEVLKSIYLDGKRKIPLFKKLLAEKNLKDYAIEAHALKSVAAVAGQNALSNLAKLHEEAGKENDMESIEESFDLLITEYENLIESLSYLSEQSEEVYAKTERSELEIKELFEKIVSCVEQFDIDELNIVMAMLKGTALSDEDEAYLQKISDAAEMLDFDSITELLIQKGMIPSA